MKNILWVILAVAVVILAVWMFKGGEKTNVDEASNTSVSTSTTNGTDTTNNPNPVVNKPVVFKSLLSMTGNFECKYEQVDPKFRSTNVVYLSGGKMRAEFRTASSTGSMANLMVYDGRDLYVWKEGSTRGTRTTPKSISELPDVIPADITSAAIYGTSPLNVSYDCHAWSTKPSMLVKPANVSFN